jgi:hypothetical protein
LNEVLSRIACALQRLYKIWLLGLHVRWFGRTLFERGDKPCLSHPVGNARFGDDDRFVEAFLDQVSCGDLVFFMWIGNSHERLESARDRIMAGEECRSRPNGNKRLF